MMTTKKIISWVKWRNPYKNFQKKNKSSNSDNYDEAGISLLDKDHDHDIDSEDDEDPTGNTLVLFTPMGPVPLTEHNDPEKIFDFWVGHTNFNITPKIQKIINKVEGVEILNVYTRYRFRIGVAKMFVPRDVTQSINRAISAHFQSQENGDEEQQISECRNGSTPCNKCRDE